MDINWRVLIAAAYYGRRQDAFENHLDNLQELGVIARQQTIEKHNTTVMAAFALGMAVGQWTETV